jgi:hypothetical protein
VNLGALPNETRPDFADALLLQLQALHDRAGRPHAILMDQAHFFLSQTGSTSNAQRRRLHEVTKIYSSSDPALIPHEILDSLQVVIELGPSAVFLEEFSRSLAAPFLADISLPHGHALVWMREHDATLIQLRHLHEQYNQNLDGAAPDLSQPRPHAEPNPYLQK